MTQNISHDDLHLRQIALENALRFHHEQIISANANELVTFHEPNNLVKTAALFEDFLRGKTEYQQDQKTR